MTATRSAALMAATLGALLALGSGQVEANRAEAKRHAKQGKRLFDLGKFAEAAEAYEKAYKAKPHPTVLFNLAQCHRRIGGSAHLKKALFYYESYLRNARKAADKAAVKKEMQKIRDELSLPSPKPVARPERPRRQVPAGQFTMGSNSRGARADERPPRRVTLSAFAIDTFEVRNADYQYCVQKKRCRPSRVAGDKRFNAPDQPVVAVSWSDAATYCRLLGGFLPSEAQWEKAARGSDGRDYPWGKGKLCTSANFGGAAGCSGRNPGVPEAVDARAADISPHGVRNMAGNVSEWVADFYQRAYYQVAPSRDPGGPESGVFRVVRGGHYGSPARRARVSARHRHRPQELREDIGFRCAYPSR
jgi:formylglycine-generating enzyme required for sulfatase activity